jgi:hypothetical protein
MSVDESECTARGVDAEADGLLFDIAGSDSRDELNKQMLRGSL